MSIRIKVGEENGYAMIGACLEGGRENLLSGNIDLRNVKGFVCNNYDSKPFHQGIGELPTHIIKLTKGDDLLVPFVVEGLADTFNYTFSFYAWTDTDERLLLSTRVSNEHEVAIMNSRVDNLTRRNVLSYSFSQESERIHFGLKLAEGVYKGNGNTLYISMLTIENRAFATSPITKFKRVGVPGIGMKINPFSLDMGILQFLFSPYWNGYDLDELGPDPHFLYCFSKDKRNGIRVYSDAKDCGLIKVHVRKDDQDHYIYSEVIPLRKRIYSIAVRWYGENVDLIINGRSSSYSSGFGLPYIDDLDDMLYLGASFESERNSPYSAVTELGVWVTFFCDEDIQAYLYSKHPEIYPWYEGLQSREPIYELACVKNDWFSEIILNLLRFSEVKEENEKGKRSRHKKEEDYRDDCYQSLYVGNHKVTQEHENHAGKTDLIILSSDDSSSRFRVEFKIWQRNDYKETPNKPLKYMSVSENVGAVIMINPNKKKDIFENYIDNVLNSNTSVIEILEQVFGVDGRPKHFVSIHEIDGRKVEIIHIVLNQNSTS